MTLTWRDGLATLLTGTAVAAYAAHLGGAGVLPGPQVLGGVLLTLGVAAAVAGNGRILNGGGARTSVIVIAISGAVAWISGLMALITGGETALAVLVGSTVVLWAVALIRHLLASRVTDRELRELIEREQDDKGRRT